MYNVLVLSYCKDLSCFEIHKQVVVTVKIFMFAYLILGYVDIKYCFDFVKQEKIKHQSYKVNSQKILNFFKESGKPSIVSRLYFYSTFEILTHILLKISRLSKISNFFC